MRQMLTRHPSSQGDATRRVEVDVAWPAPGRLRLTYRVEGEVKALRLPPPVPPQRADELWKHTCLEAFIAPGEGAGYLEFNFSPSTRWAAYRFDAPRQGMRNAEVVETPRIGLELGDEFFAQTVDVDLSGAEGIDPDLDWRLALTAIVEQADGATSYWALRHPDGRPDFHHPDGFSLRVTPAERA